MEFQNFSETVLPSKFKIIADITPVFKIKSQHKPKTVELKFDTELKLDEHLTNICIKANRKLTVLTRTRKYLDFNKVRLLFKSFLNPSSNIVLSLRCFTLEKLMIGSINFMRGF